MPENFADRLLAAIKDKKSPTCVGIDPVYSRLPAEIAEHRDLNDETDSEAALDAILEFSRRIIKIVAPHVPAIKINTAFFERYYADGIDAYMELLQEAADHKLIAIGDCKRGDIGSTSEMYAKSALSDPDFINLDDLVGPDAITVNAWAGIEGVQPFIDVAREEQKGLFVWVKATNPARASSKTPSWRTARRSPSTWPPRSACGRPATSSSGGPGTARSERSSRPRTPRPPSECAN